MNQTKTVGVAICKTTSTHPLVTYTNSYRHTTNMLYSQRQNQLTNSK